MTRSDVPGRQPYVAGVVAALVGFTSSFAVVLAGLRAVGASGPEAASGLLVLCVAQAVGMIVLSWRYRMPLTLAWSTPGAAMLAGAAATDGGWPAAVGAFAVTGLLIVATAAWPALGGIVARIPAPVAHAMLAGVLLPLCLEPVRGLAASPWMVAPIVVTWLVLLRLAPRWAVPAAFAVTMAVVALWLAQNGDSLDGPLLPHLVWTAPSLEWQAVVGIALPLYVVTMAAQNVPGVAVMASYGFTVPWRATMATTGVGTLLGASAGGHAINLAAITAALAAGPEAGPDPRRRWLAAHTAGWAYLVIALLSTALATVVAAAPRGVVEAAAGLALVGTLGASLHAAMSATVRREPAVITFVVAASGVTVAGIGAAFWALVAGVAAHLVLRSPRPGPATSPSRTPAR
ncbi:benzoate/H(+) symporter BenE family transporter [Mumia sp. ZJ1417]|uniref:benzoate/H(+) symporter BenE family transporter n=1 Tax=Mumia sp. ZJ1417 TaxID=2708082 RepID=UPI0014205010|nr:benzoate/H(+) symporter BenE family transporter [Mumia sp. ZJ1417]QMW67566.1 benzoate/H(+) symporter BenE family transporter [Mumia sp. ZJ1417]